MKDPRNQQLAEVLVAHSTRLQPGERVLIEAFDIPQPFVVELIRAVEARKAIPVVSLKNNAVTRALIQALPEEGFLQWGEFEATVMERMQAYIGVRGSHNIAEFSDLDATKMDYYKTHVLKPVHFDIRVPKTKWVVLRYPTASMAQQAGMSTEAFEDFYFKVCTLNYEKMSQNMQALKERMEATDRVLIVGPNTELEFSIKGIPAIPCGGEHNIPDGECFTAPVKESVNGHIQFNTPTIYEGTVFNNIRLEFKAGKIIRATADKTDKLNQILDTDEGARYIGEFAIGFNPHVTRPMLDILFDEKMAGSFHFTPGQAYEEADNGNQSKVHWDMVMLQTPEYGGGKIYFDQELIRENGRFVPKDLQPLNPENLL
ncbi:MAG: aminopeptidase [Calditrichaeota bacterium]|nr:MAG: aminopeptidase [Calditrichota bacterium]